MDYKALAQILLDVQAGNVNSLMAFEKIDTLIIEHNKTSQRWRPIETAPRDTKTMFVVKAFDVEGWVYGKYTTDPYAVWVENGEFIRWPHLFRPTHMRLRDRRVALLRPRFSPISPWPMAYDNMAYGVSYWKFSISILK